MKRLVIRAYKCWGCRTCEETCARVHRSGRLKGVSRIVVVEEDKYHRVPVTCLQCEDAACVMACKFGALVRNEKTGAVERDDDRCTRCYACLVACPFGNVAVDKKSGRVVKCDLCSGDPECVKTCPSGTLSI